MQRRASFRRLAIEPLSAPGAAAGGVQHDMWKMPEVSSAATFQSTIPSAEPRRTVENPTPPEDSAMLGFQDELCAI